MLVSDPGKKQQIRCKSLGPRVLIRLRISSYTFPQHFRELGEDASATRGYLYFYTALCWFLPSPRSALSRVSIVPAVPSDQRYAAICCAGALHFAPQSDREPRCRRPPHSGPLPLRPALLHSTAHPHRAPSATLSMAYRRMVPSRSTVVRCGRAPPFFRVPSRTASTGLAFLFAIAYARPFWSRPLRQCCRAPLRICRVRDWCVFTILLKQPSGTDYPGRPRQLVRG